LVVKSCFLFVLLFFGLLSFLGSAFNIQQPDRFLSFVSSLTTATLMDMFLNKANDYTSVYKPVRSF
jgi:1,4-dihydroxy-2-naphthoate octaprenyltransferase